MRIFKVVKKILESRMKEEEKWCVVDKQGNKMDNNENRSHGSRTT